MTTTQSRQPGPPPGGRPAVASPAAIQVPLRGSRADEPEMPGGQLQLQPPPQIQASEGAAGIAMNAIPMLGSVGSIVLVAALGSTGGGGKSFLAGGMFLFATLGFIFVQIDRQRKQRNQQVTGSRTEYLRYLSSVRTTARDAAERQRRALTWHHPDPSSLPALAEERTRVWEHTPSDPRFLHVRYGLCAQPLALELVPPESAPIDDVDPAAASALHRLLVVHRTQPDLPASVDLRSFDRIELCGEEEQARALARAIICSATAFQSPESLVVAVLSSEDNLAHWDWIKWLPHALSPEQSDAVGAMRMVSTSLSDLAALLPPDLGDRPRFGADDRQATPHILLVTDGAELPPGNHVVPPDGLHGVTVLDLPSRWMELEDASRLRLLLEPGEPDADDKVAVQALRVREEPIRAKADQCDQATAEAFARRLTPLHSVTVSGAASDLPAGEITGPTDFMDLLGLGDVRAFEPSAAWRRRPSRDRLRVPIGLGESGALVHLDIKESAQQGMGPHGLVIGATGSGKSEFLRTLVLGPGDDPLPRAAQHGARRLQGRRDLRRDVADAARLGGHHQPLPGAHPGRPHAGRPVGRDGAPPGAAARGRQLRLRCATTRRHGPPARTSPRCRRCSSWSTSSPRCCRPSPSSSTCSWRSAGSAARSACTCCWPRSGWRRAACAGLESHLSYRVGLRTFSAQESRAVLGVPDAYELPAVPGLGLPQARPDHDDPVQGGVRLRPAGRGAGARRPRRGRARARDPAVHDLRGPLAPGRARAGARGPDRARSRRRPCSTSPSTTWSATAWPRTRSGCRRSTSPTRSTS